MQSTVTLQKVSTSTTKLVDRPVRAVRRICIPLLISTSEVSSRVARTTVAENVRRANREDYVRRVTFSFTSLLIMVTCTTLTTNVMCTNVGKIF